MKRYSKPKSIDLSDDNFSTIKVNGENKVQKFSNAPIWYRIVCLGISLFLLFRLYLSNNSLNTSYIIDQNVKT